MLKRLALFVSLLAATCAADNNVTLRGEVKNVSSYTDVFLSVELVDPQSQRVVERTFTSSDGGFEMNEVPSGIYELRVVTQFGEVLLKSDADVRQTGVVSVSLALPQAAVERPAGESISVARLRHKPPKAALKAAVEAQKRSERGDFAGAAEHLRKAIRIDPEFSAAHTNLGAQLIRLRKPVEAEVEFRRALELDPADALNHSNLAFALLMLNRLAEAEPLGRRAVKMDSTSIRTHCVLGYILARRAETQHEAMEHLRYAARETPQAGKMLAQLERITKLSGPAAGATRKGLRAGQ